MATGGFGASCIATSMLVGAVKGAVIGAVTGAVTGAIQGAITEGIKTGSWEGALKGALSGAIDGAADGFMFGAIGGAISGAINPSYCFIAGTMVMTAVGLRRIEEIKRAIRFLPTTTILVDTRRCLSLIPISMKLKN